MSNKCSGENLIIKSNVLIVCVERGAKQHAGTKKTH
jgi:hypothetical protein